MNCNECGVDKKLIAKGLCAACYTRQIRGGRPRTYKVNKNQVCSVSDCRQPSVSKGFCLKHYRQKHEHPLKTIWKLIRSRAKGKYPAQWDDFNLFLADVGARPSPQHQLRKIAATEPYSKENLEWLAPLAGSKNGNSVERATYSKGFHLRRNYKMTQADYDAMLIAQKGVCAICKKLETQVIKRTGRVKELSVDHAHDESQKIRGLVCSKCNLILGYANDDPALLRAAIAYLESHEALSTQPPA